MKRLEMPKDFYIEELDLTVKPYIPADIVVDIAETALTMNNRMEQEICVAVNVLRECTDANVDEALDNMDVDYIMYSGMWDIVEAHIMNVDAIWEYIEHSEDVGVAIAKFLNVTLADFLEKIDGDLTKYIDNMPQGEELTEFIKNAPEKLNEVLSMVKENDNAEIIKGAMALNEVKVDDDK